MTTHGQDVKVRYAVFAVAATNDEDAEELLTAAFYTLSEQTENVDGLTRLFGVEIAQAALAEAEIQSCAQDARDALSEALEEEREALEAEDD